MVTSRELLLHQAALIDTLAWAKDYELLNGRKPSGAEVEKAFKANQKRRHQPVLWPGIDY